MAKPMMDTETLAKALNAAAYFQRKGRLVDAADTMETIAEIAEGTATIRGLHAIQFLIEDHEFEVKMAELTAA